MQSDDWRPGASPEALRMRAALYAALRRWFDRQGVLEVETPILCAAGNPDPNIRSFTTRYSGPSDAGQAERWLRTSPEFALKRLLAAGVGDCYELGRVFRDGEAGRRHNPEFTMLEWYRTGRDHVGLMQDVEQVVELALALVGRGVRIERCSYRALYQAHFGFDPFSASVETLRQPLAGHSIRAEGLERDDWLDLLMTHLLQPRMDPGTLLFVHDYPASQCALARLREDSDALVAERFEAYLGSVELANGYHELADAVEQEQRFEREIARRRARGDALPVLDRRLLAGLQHGLPRCAGVALGVDRLLSVMMDSAAMTKVIAFDFGRA